MVGAPGVTALVLTANCKMLCEWFGRLCDQPAESAPSGARVQVLYQRYYRRTLRRLYLTLSDFLVTRPLKFLTAYLDLLEDRFRIDVVAQLVQLWIAGLFQAQAVADGRDQAHHTRYLVLG